VLFSLLAIPFLSHAGKADFEQQIEMSYQYQSLDVRNKTSLLRGDVSIKQGSLNMQAAEMDVDAKSGKGKEKFIARGKQDQPATYQQMLDDGTLITASADSIEYDRHTRILRLTGNAQIEQNASKVKGQVIIFNMELEQVIAEGDQSKPVITIFKPKAQDTP
jgi:lipopolysaccharide export system protein LptA